MRRLMVDALREKTVSYSKLLWPILPILGVVNLTTWLAFGATSTILNIVVAAWFATGYKATVNLSAGKGCWGQLIDAGLFPHVLFKAGERETLTHAFRGLCVSLIVCFTLGLYILAPSAATLSDSVNGVRTLLISVTAVWIIVIAFRVVFSVSSSAPFRGLKELGYAFLTFLFISAGIRHVGGDLELWLESALNDPQLLLPWLLLIITLAAMWLTYRLLATRLDWLLNLTNSAAISDSASFAPSGDLAEPISQKDLEHIAIHEAGHALVYAAAPDRLVTATVKTHKVAPYGYVRRVESDSVFPTKAVLSLDMFVMLAGIAAQRLVLGTDKSGGNQDMRMWQSLAKVYLESGFGDTIIAEPQNEQEVVYNVSVFDALRRSQERLLDELMITNRGLLRELADELLERKVMKGYEIQPFLERVVLPEGFVKLSEVEEK